MSMFYSYIFFIVYFLSVSLGVIIYFHYVYYKDKCNKNSNVNLKNIILVNKKTLLKSKKRSEVSNEDLIQFPAELYNYIRKPSPSFLSEMLLYVSTNEKTKEITDIFRCISISSILFNKEIPLIFVKLDERTRILLSLIEKDLELKNVLIMSYYLQKIKDIILNNNDEYEKCLRNFKDHLKTIGTLVLKYNEESSFPSIHIFTEEFSNELNKDFTLQEVMSLCTAFSAITVMKIPKSYIKIDLLTLSLIHCKKSKGHLNDQ